MVWRRVGERVELSASSSEGISGSSSARGHGIEVRSPFFPLAILQGFLICWIVYQLILSHLEISAERQALIEESGEERPSTIDRFMVHS